MIFSSPPTPLQKERGAAIVCEGIHVNRKISPNHETFVRRTYTHPNAGRYLSLMLGRTLPPMEAV
jgi:hypothetical protein